MWPARRTFGPDLWSSGQTPYAVELSARELTDAALNNIDAWNVQVNAFVAVDAERARAEADSIDARLAAGETVGALAGIPIGVKDLEDARGFITTFGSAAHARDVPAERDSVLVERLRSAGCVVIGKTNTPEFGLKPLTDNVTFGITRNPWDHATPGVDRAAARRHWPLASSRWLQGLTAADLSVSRQPCADFPGSSPHWGGYPRAIRTRRPGCPFHEGTDGTTRP